MLDKTDDSEPIVNEQNPIPIIIHSIVSTLSKSVDAVISPKPTVVKTVIDQYILEVYAVVLLLSKRPYLATHVSGLKLSIFAEKYQKHPEI